MASAAVERRVVADPAGQLDRDVEPADDLGELLAVVAPAERRVEVDQVDPLGAGLLPGEGGGERVAVVRLAAGLALDQPHGLPVGDVDGRQQHQAVGHRRASDVTRGTYRSSQPADPVLEQGRASVAGLLRVELGRRERPVLDRRDETARRGRPR